MLALDKQLDKPRCLQTVKMDAGRGRGNPCNDGEFGTRASVAVHQAKKNAGASRLANGNGNARDRHLRWFIEFHCLMVDEV
jgi:hypothetical protein